MINPTMLKKIEDWKLHIPQGKVFCYLSKTNTQSQLRAAHPALLGPVSESAVPRRLVVSKAVDGSSNSNIHVFPCSAPVRSSPTRITRAVSMLHLRLIPDYEERWILAGGVLDTPFPVFLLRPKSSDILSTHLSQTCWGEDRWQREI